MIYYITHTPFSMSKQETASVAAAKIVSSLVSPRKYGNDTRALKAVTTNGNLKD